MEGRLSSARTFKNQFWVGGNGQGLPVLPALVLGPASSQPGWLLPAESTGWPPAQLGGAQDSALPLRKKVFMAKKFGIDNPKSPILRSGNNVML